MTTKRWLGNAAAVADVWTITLSGTVTSQTYTLMINSKSISYTATGGDTVSTVLAGIQSAWSAISPAPPVEFTELTATALPIGGPFTSVVLTGNTPGKPCTITISTSGGATFTIAHDQSATGPHDFANPLNWSGGIAPVNSDTLVFDSGSIPCRYNLITSLTGITLSVEPGYSGQIGLPFINSDSSTAYAEYRPTSLTLVGGTAVINSSQIGRCNLAFGANMAVIRILATGTRVDRNIPVCLITGGDGSSELDITTGDVGLAWYQGTTSTMPIIRTGYLNNATSDVSLIVGTGATLNTVTKNGGLFDTRSSLATLNQDLAGGTSFLRNDVTLATANVYNGTLFYCTTGVIGTINLFNRATFNANTDPRGKTITNPINVYSTTVTVLDDQKSINAGTLSINMNGMDTVNVSHGANTTLVLT